MKKSIIIILSVVMIFILGTAFVIAEGVFTDEQQEWYDARVERVEELVKEGVITQEKADDYIEQLEQCIAEGTCKGYGTGCIEGEDCSFGISSNGRCYRVESDNGNGSCGLYDKDNAARGCESGYTGYGIGRGCGR